MKSTGFNDFIFSLNEFEKRFRGRTGQLWKDRHEDYSANSEYRLTRRIYEPETTDEIDTDISEDEDESETSEKMESELPLATQRLVKTIFNRQIFVDTIKSMRYDTEKLPLDHLSEDHFRSAYRQLNQINSLIHTDSRDEIEWIVNLERATNTLNQIIPCVSGDWKQPVIDSPDRLRKEVRKLELLSDMVITYKLMKAGGGKANSAIPLVDRQFAGLGLQTLVPGEFFFKIY